LPLILILIRAQRSDAPVDRSRMGPHTALAPAPPLLLCQPLPASRRLLAAALTIAALCGCRPPPAQAPCDRPLAIDLVIDGGEELNPATGGEAWPTHLRLYQLDARPDLDALHGATIAADDTPLREGALGRSERVIYPASHERWPLTIPAEATHLTIIALFNRPEPGSWGATIELPEAPAVCPAKSSVRACVYVSVDGYELRAGIHPPPGFTGDGGPCAALLPTPSEPTLDRASRPKPNF